MHLYQIWAENWAGIPQYEGLSPAILSNKFEPIIEKLWAEFKKNTRGYANFFVGFDFKQSKGGNIQHLYLIWTKK